MIPHAVNNPLKNVPVAVPPDVNKLTATFLASVPFSIDTVTLTLPASSSTEYVTGSNPIVITADRRKLLQYTV